MLFTITAIDKENSLDVRMATREAHLSYLKEAGERIKVAGPLLTSGAEPKPLGSLIIIDAASEAAVNLFAENDPYATAGLFASVTVRPWNAAVGEWASGT